MDPEDTEDDRDEDDEVSPSLYSGEKDPETTLSPKTPTSSPTGVGDGRPQMASEGPLSLNMGRAPAQANSS